MKALKKFFEAIIFTLGLNGEIRKNAVDDGICDFSGQGKNKYGN